MLLLDEFICPECICPACSAHSAPSAVPRGRVHLPRVLAILLGGLGAYTHSLLEWRVCGRRLRSLFVLPWPAPQPRRLVRVPSPPALPASAAASASAARDAASRSRRGRCRMDRLGVVACSTAAMRLRALERRLRDSRRREGHQASESAP